MRHVCSVDGCGLPVKGLGLCNKHYIRARKGSPLEGGKWSHGSQEDRFWRYVDKRSEDECWLWTGQLMLNGYGRMSSGSREAGAVSAHRFSCALHHGEPPYEGAHVMHLCDNRACVNPAHLRWCTPAENIQDAYDKGRKQTPFQRGERHHASRLNVEQVRFVKANPDMKQAQLARLLGCSRSAIAAIREGRTWQHVT